jgi:hypothetical protein
LWEVIWYKNAWFLIGCNVYGEIIKIQGSVPPKLDVPELTITAGELSTMAKSLDQIAYQLSCQNKEKTSKKKILADPIIAELSEKRNDQLGIIIQFKHILSSFGEMCSAESIQTVEAAQNRFNALSQQIADRQKELLGAAETPSQAG